jgi:Putative peptidoglycan binding domain
MARAIMRRARNGFRASRGEVVRRAQVALSTEGANPGTIDGVFGGDTERALATFQSIAGLQATGELTDETWGRLLNGIPVPSLLERCLQLTADFEGHGFQKVAGNFDGAGLTWGIIGFTLKGGELPAMLGQIRERHPALLSQAFGALEPELLTALASSRERQLEWANGLSLGTTKYRIEPRWEAPFAKLGSYAEVQAIQLERVQRYWQIATRDTQRFELTTEMGAALCLDVAVQNGGIDAGDEERAIRRWITEHPGAGEHDRRVRIADVVAESSRARYVEDVRARKRTLATGEGMVHGARYATADWGIADLPSA